jgi:hypothetical protein
VKQRVSIAVVPSEAAHYLLKRAKKMLSEDSVTDYFDSLIVANAILFHSNHLDLWSMGDSFDRFLRPKSQVHFIDGGMSQLYAIPRDRIALRAAARNDDERLLQVLLQSAKSSYRDIPGAFIFLLRQVFGLSGDFIDLQPKLTVKSARE